MDQSKQVRSGSVRSRARAGRGWKTWPLVIAAVLIAAGIAGAVSLRAMNNNNLTSFSTFTTAKGNLLITVVESGSLEADKYVELASEVEGQSSIVSIVPEGTQVNAGDVVVTLDSSNLQDNVTQQEVSFQNAQASYINSQENRGILEKQTESDISGAKLTLDFANIDLEKYEKGDYPQALRQATNNVTIAEEDLARANSQFEGDKKLYESGYVTKSEYDADEFAVTKAGLSLTQATEAKRLLEQYTHDKDLKKLNADVDEANRELDRVQRRAKAQLAQADADLVAKKATFDLQQQRLEKLKQQLSKTVIKAPQPGLVVYSSSGSDNRFSSRAMIEQGASVRERQAIVRLPDVRTMMARVRIHESSIDKVRAGQPAFVTIDAFPDQRLKGRVKKVAILPDSQSSFLNPDIKVYTTDVNIDDQLPDLKPGMSAKVEIVVASLADVIYVPVQAVFRAGKGYICYVLGPMGIEQRAVKIGLGSDKFQEIKEGLREGEKVLLQAPPGAHTAAEEVEKGVPAESPLPTVLPSVPQGQPTSSPAPGAQSFEEMRSQIENMTPEERQRYFEERRSQRQGQGGASGLPGGQMPEGTSGQRGGSRQGGQGRGSSQPAASASPQPAAAQPAAPSEGRQ